MSAAINVNAKLPYCVYITHVITRNTETIIAPEYLYRQVEDLCMLFLGLASFILHQWNHGKAHEVYQFL